MSEHLEKPMAYTPDTITVELLMRVRGSTEVHEIATVDLPITFVHTASGDTRHALDYSPIEDAGKAIADALRAEDIPPPPPAPRPGQGAR